jgi:hypothetical protein
MYESGAISANSEIGQVTGYWNYLLRRVKWDWCPSPSFESVGGARESPFADDGLVHDEAMRG